MIEVNDCILFTLSIHEELDSTLVDSLASGARGPGSVPVWGEKFSGSDNTPLASVAGMMLIECTILQI